jgi:flagellar hook-associated protein 2
MAISASGLGSGLDIRSIVDQLVNAERQPAANRLTNQEAKANAQLSALGQLKSALAGFRSALEGLGDMETLEKRSVTIEPKDHITVTATPKAVTGSFDVEVLALASSQKLASGAFAGPDAVVGTGTLSIAVGGVPLQLTINETNNTLSGIRDAINNAPGNPGVRATVVNAEGGSYLLLSAEKTGVANNIMVDALEQGSGLEALEFGEGTSNALVEKQAAADAEVVIDGLTVRSATNTVEGAMEGITINLLKAEPGTTIEVGVAVDVVALKAALKSFVDAYNGLVDTVKKLTAYDPNSRTAGPLLGDGPTRNLLAGIRSALAGRLGGTDNAFSSLVQVGVKSDVTGKLSLDVATLDKAIATDIGDLGRLFAADTTGLADRLDKLLGDTLSSTGTLATREQNLKNRLKTITGQREVLDRRMEEVRRRYERQFNAMDQLVSQLNTSGSYLLQALSNLG